MAHRHRNRNFLQNIFQDEQIIQEMKESNCDQCIVKAGYSVLNKCGNCGMRFKCGTDMIQIFRQKTDLLGKLGLEDADSGKLMEMADYTYQFLQEEMGEEKIQELIAGLIEMMDVEPEQVINSLNEVFGNCIRFNDINLIQDISYLDDEENDDQGEDDNAV